MSGTQLSMVQRLLNAQPTNWFINGEADADGRAYRNYAQKVGTAAVFQQVYNQVMFAQNQQRIGTSSGGYLDLTSRGYFGTRLPRASGENDAMFAARILAYFFRPQVTYDAMITALEALTGNVPIIIRPRRASDCGAWGTLANRGQGTLAAWDAGGYWGSLRMPFQAGIQIQLPAQGAIPNRAGYGTRTSLAAAANWGGGGFGHAGVGGGVLAWSQTSEMSGGVSYQDIYNVILDTELEGTEIWVQITAPTPSVGSVDAITPAQQISSGSFSSDFSGDFGTSGATVDGTGTVTNTGTTTYVQPDFGGDIQ